MVETSKGGLFNTEKLIFGIRQVTQITGVSSRQLRYWEQQNYISPIQQKKGTSRQYDMHTLLKIANIQRFLSQGFTLSVAVEKAIKVGREAPLIRDFVLSRMNGVNIESDDRATIDFGFLDDSHKQRVLGVIDHGKTSFEIIDEV
ncbi:MerR family transcriptional regulator [Lentilactobacillus sp. SPB1-3]|uniref:MerR family transcriptional regulator n=1 Tax=Lentilactobacillus terminaliae TaxID=3003483 RepID=A0ACD5DDC0_9LACO|nr:MerR family transcriptional regulator [Lentilactobacillus sp. SPB1-3]MCZ0977800.1 MerR family transcriptional regulator [Lentilactobacillus sp. SPB1-3]